MERVELSVVVPVYGCDECLHALHDRLTKSVAQLVSSYEIVLVDDRSPDGSWETMGEIAAADAHVRLVRLSRNFGQHAAITAGLAHASGKKVVVMDCDLQEPPEEIPRLYAKAQEGFDVVLSRRKRRRQNPLRRFAAYVYLKLANFMAGADLYPNLTNLSILDRKVVDAFLGIKDVDRQYLLILLWLGFEHDTIEIEEAERYAGKSAYKFSQLVRVALDGIFFQTATLLRWVIYGGFAIAFVGVVAAGSLIAYSYAARNPPPGWASLGVLVMVLSGVIVISTGVTGLYVGKVFGQVKGRPLYVVDTLVEDGTRSEVDAQPTVGSPVER